MDRGDQSDDAALAAACIDPSLRAYVNRHRELVRPVPLDNSPISFVRPDVGEYAHIPGLGWICCRVLHGLFEEVRCGVCGGWRHPDADLEVATKRVRGRVRRREAERAAA